MDYRPLNLKPLTTDEFRMLMRSKGNTFLPDQVAEGLADRTFAIDPTVIYDIADDISRLVDEMRKWLADAGLEVSDATEAELKVDRRERERIRTMAILLPYHAFGLYFTKNDLSAAESATDEAVAWGSILGDQRLLSFAWGGLAQLLSQDRKPEAEHEALTRALGHAEAPGDDPMMELMIGGEFTAMLVTNHHLDEAEEMIERMLERGRSALTPTDQQKMLPLILMNRGRLLSMRGQGGKAIMVLREARDLLRASGVESMILPPVLSHIGLEYRLLGDHHESLVHFQESIDVAEQIGDSMGMAWGHIRMAESYWYLRDYDNAERRLTMARTLIPEVSAGRALDYLYVMWARLHRSMKRYDEAVEYCRRFLDLSPDSPTPGKANAYQIMAEIAEERGDLDEGEKYFREALEVVAELGDGEHPTPMLLGLARLLGTRGEVDQAVEILDSVIAERGDAKGTEDAVGYAWQLLSGIAESRGEHHNALTAARRAFELRVRALMMGSEKSVNDARVLAEIDLLRKEAELERIQRKEAESSLAETLAAFEDNRMALATVEQGLRETLSMLDRKKAREIIDVLREALDNIDRAPERGDTSLHYLQTLDRAFFERLRERYPQLTRKQEHLCGLIRAGLSSREIAAALDISNEGIRSQRKRLRKRLGLETEENLESVIMGI